MNEEVLTLADGTQVSAINGKKLPPMHEIPSNSQALRLVTRTQRKLEDLPDLPERMNTISAVLSYSLFGLSDAEIGYATGLRSEQVTNIKMLDSYLEMNKAVTQSIMSHDKEEVQRVLEGGASLAAQRMIELIGSDDEDIQLKASKDVLDRNGHQAANLLEVRHMMQKSLRIEHIIRTDEKYAPIIDITPVEVIEDGNCS